MADKNRYNEKCKGILLDALCVHKRKVRVRLDNEEIVEMDFNLEPLVNEVLTGYIGRKVIVRNNGDVVLASAINNRNQMKEDKSEKI